MQDDPGVRLPIYDSIESEWFRRGGTSLNDDGQPPARSGHHPRTKASASPRRLSRRPPTG